MEGRTDLERLGRFVRERRKELGLTQTALGDRLGWSQERVSVFENGKYGLPSLPHLSRLADALAVPLLELLRPVGIDGLHGVAVHGRDQPAESPRLHELRVRMAGAIDRMHAVELNLHAAERELAAAEALRASIRDRRQRMAELLAGSREQ